jgi:hypothetical protein
MTTCDPPFKTNINCISDNIIEVKNSNGDTPEGDQSAQELPIRAVTVKVPMKIADQDILAVVDTGAEVTVMKGSLFQSLPNNIQSRIHESKCKLVVAEQGHHMEVQGVVDIPLKIGNHQFEWKVYIPPIADDLLLGCDIMN